MKSNRFAVLALCCSSFAFAAPSVPPLLVKKVGGLASQGTVKICEIFPSHGSISPDEVVALIAQAQSAGELETIAVFNHAQVPSKEIYAMRGETRVFLEVIHGRHLARTSEAAKRLIQLTDELCAE